MIVEDFIINALANAENQSEFPGTCRQTQPNSCISRAALKTTGLSLYTVHTLNCWSVRGAPLSTLHLRPKKRTC
ncbi:hypothetical protein Poly21_29580 [Allorhodopirellula heiligendammensis]|uniref:Uncharacterized protein n=1 Tax=Allorhodopirellula heiligendammensis TaxID=2714739 RepID=A0A5C6BWV4_9BACT|nr:hypothetical protein Poly21_29580 [Allorhodopirellula heiligendammensis]